MSKVCNPGSIANRGGSKPHGGFPTPSVGAKRTTKASTPGDKGWQGGPPTAGFTVRAKGKKTGGKVTAPTDTFQHLGRFATGKPVTMSRPPKAVPPITNR